MATYQYRICGELEWQSNSGNAIFAIVNKQNSGKKLVIKNIELTPLTNTTTLTTGSISAGRTTMLSLCRGSVTSSLNITPTKLDLSASLWPSGVIISKQATFTTGSGTAPIRRISLLKQCNPANNTYGSRQTSHGMFGRIFKNTRDTSVEKIVIRQNEGIALFADVYNNSSPLRVTATLTHSGSTNRTHTFSYFTNMLHEQTPVFAVNNTSGSGEVVLLNSISVEEVGTYATPYFQLVPISQVIAESQSDVNRTLNILPMDSIYPSASTWMSAFKDVIVLPFGMPESAFAEGSAGAPRGFSYLKTKDFVGPVWRAAFPESVAFWNNNIPDTFAAVSHRFADLGVKRANITIREGEGAALVSAAETATGTTAIDSAGYSSWFFGMTISIEPKLDPVLTITGLKVNSEVRIFEANTTTEITGQENIVSGSFSWQFDPEEYPLVDIHVLSLGYQNLRLRNQALTLADLTIPVQQQVDRQYLNP